MTNTQPDADDLLEDLLIENHITIKDVYNCAEQHEDELMNIMNIYDLENDRDRLLALTILNLLAGEQGGEVTDLYCRDYGIEKENYLNNYTKEDIKLLLTACLFDQVFLSFTMRLYKQIKAKLKSKPGIGKEEKHGTPFRNNIVPVGQGNGIWNIPYEKIAADGEGFVPFLTQKHMEYSGVCGTLELRKNRYNQVQFLFVFDQDKYPEKKPFELEVQFTTKKSGPHTVHINLFNKGNVITHIFSNIESGIDFSEGIEGDFTVIAKET